MEVPVFLCRTGLVGCCHARCSGRHAGIVLPVFEVLTRVGLRGRGAAVRGEGDGTGDGLRGGKSARMKECVVTGVSLERLDEKGLWVVLLLIWFKAAAALQRLCLFNASVLERA